MMGMGKQGTNFLQRLRMGMSLVRGSNLMTMATNTASKNMKDFIRLGMVKLADTIHMTKCLVFRMKIYPSF
jgi:hypothetical protein